MLRLGWLFLPLKRWTSELDDRFANGEDWVRKTASQKRDKVCLFFGLLIAIAYFRNSYITLSGPREWGLVFWKDLSPTMRRCATKPSRIIVALSDTHSLYKSMYPTYSITSGHAITIIEGFIARRCCQNNNSLFIIRNNAVICFRTGGMCIYTGDWRLVPRQSKEDGDQVDFSLLLVTYFLNMLPDVSQRASQS